MFRICRNQRGFGGYEIVRFRRFVGRITFAATASSLIKLFESTRPTITLSIVLKDIMCATLAPGKLLGSKTVLQTNVGCPQPLLQCQGSRRLQGNFGQHLGSFLFISDFIRQCVMLVTLLIRKSFPHPCDNCRSWHCTRLTGDLTPLGK